MESVFNLTAEASCANLIASARASSCGEKENGLRRRLRTTDAFVTFSQLAAHKARDLDRAVGYTVKSRHTSFHRTVSFGMNGVPTKEPAPLSPFHSRRRTEERDSAGSEASHNQEAASLLRSSRRVGRKQHTGKRNEKQNTEEADTRRAERERERGLAPQERGMRGQIAGAEGWENNTKPSKS